MTIHHPNKFYQALPAGFDGLFGWDFLKPAFAGTKVEPMDVDAMVERYGKFLLFETKNVGKEIPLGQQIALESAVRMGRGKILVMVLWGKTAMEIESIQEWYWERGRFKKSLILSRNAEYVLRRVSGWFAWAS